LRFLPHARLEELPPDAGEWRALRVLAVAGNRLRRLPPGLAGLDTLEALDASGNRLDALPPGLSRLTRLARLDASGNDLAEVPPGLLAALTGLTDLGLSGNRLRPGGVDAGLLTALQGLTALRLADNAGLFAERGRAGGGGGGDGGTGGVRLQAAQQQAEGRLREWLDEWLLGPGARSRPASALSPRGGPLGGGAAPGQALPRLRALDLSGTGLPALPAWLPAGLSELRAARNSLRELPAWACARLSGGLAALDMRGNPGLGRLPREVPHLLQLRLLQLEGCACCGTGAGAGSPAAEGSAEWAAEWLAARKAGRQWPPPRGGRRPVVAVFEAAGLPLPSPQPPGRAEPPFTMGAKPRASAAWPALSGGSSTGHRPAAASLAAAAWGRAAAV
jgi:hypothetical protein